MRRATEKDLFGPRGGAAVQQRRQVSANGGVLNKEPQLSRAAEVRKVEAAIGMSGMDISQKYDAFGNNSFSSADNPWMAFFGAPTAPWKTTSYDKYDRHNYSLPEVCPVSLPSMRMTNSLTDTFQRPTSDRTRRWPRPLMSSSTTRRPSTRRSCCLSASLTRSACSGTRLSSMSTLRALCRSRAFRAW